MIKQLYMKSFGDHSVDKIVFDPPYSQYQLKLMYKDIGGYFHNSPDKDQAQRITKYWSNCKKEIVRITEKNAKVISFGWNSNGIGKKYDSSRCTRWQLYMFRNIKDNFLSQLGLGQTLERA